MENAAAIRKAKKDRKVIYRKTLNMATLSCSG